MRPLVAAATIIVVVLLALSVGEQHKSNCIDQGHIGCGVLPWNNGQPGPHKPQTQLQRLEKKYGLKR